MNQLAQLDIKERLERKYEKLSAHPKGLWSPYGWSRPLSDAGTGAEFPASLPLMLISSLINFKIGTNKINVFLR